MIDNVTIVILAAGLGTRMVSRKAKVLHQAGGLTLIEHVVKAAMELTSPERVVVVVGHQAECVQQTLEGSGVRFVLQREQKGTGHALAQCASLISESGGQVIVAYGDCPMLKAETLQRLRMHHASANAAATLITTDLPDPAGYGRIIRDASGNVIAIVEEKVATAEQKAICHINSGIYCFEAGLLWQCLPEIKPNPISHEYYLTDIVEVFNQRGSRVSALVHQDAYELLGINTRLELSEVDRQLRKRKIHELMKAGVSVLHPETVLVDMAVNVGMDSLLEPLAQLLGNTVVGENCRIGTGAILQDCRIAENVHIAPYSILNGSVVGSKATIGPFARLRDTDQVAAGAHIGNFVELKKTKLGAGAKAGHFAYLGNAEIGDDSNIGAGTIVCNYDGKKKHRSQLGQRTFIGSNSTLVAPVNIGDDAYVAAGSVITHSVPPDALAIGRSRQSNKEGWAKRRRDSK